MPQTAGRLHLDRPRALWVTAAVAELTCVVLAPRPYSPVGLEGQRGGADRVRGDRYDAAELDACGGSDVHRRGPFVGAGVAELAVDVGSPRDDRAVRQERQGV